MKIISKGRVSVYEKDGSYQLYCTEMQPEGIGELYIAFQNLKDKLEKQGLFDLKHKRPIPEFPQKIGVVTSPTGAAIKDIINVATRRNKHIDILIYPSLVQGLNASEDIIRGIEYLNRRDVDTIILARGGGSIEELWAFNDESLASAIYNSKKPIITDVGHETDFTIADFVSDRRAPTPSAAAEIAVPNLNELNNRILSFSSMFNNIISNYIKTKYTVLGLLRRELEINSPANLLIHEYNHIDKLMNTLDYVIKGRMSMEIQKLGSLHSLLSAHNPLNILNKGYSIIEDAENNIINNIEKLKSVDIVKVTLKDGRASFRILEEK
jgi:exodeoxyribonuclease VII large subunit